MDKCDEELCPGHLGKFDDCLTEALYELNMLSAEDESTGHVEFRGYFCLFDIEAPVDLWLDELMPSQRTVTVPVGVYVLVQTDQGFVYNIAGSEDELRARFAAEQHDYWAWEGDEY